MRWQIRLRDELHRLPWHVHARRTVGWSLVYALAAFGGRLTIIDGGALSLVWPAAGVAAVWFYRTPAVWLPVDLLALSACAGVINAITGAPPGLALAFIAANTTQVLLFTAMCRSHPSPDAQAGASSRTRSREFEPLTQVSQLWRNSQHALVATAAGASVGSLGATLALGSFGAADVVVWWARNMTGTVVVLSAAGVLARYRQPSSLARSVARAGDEALELLRLRGPEVVALLAFSAAAYWTTFIEYPDLPVIFVIMLATLWAGTRFGPAFAILHASGVSAAVVGFTLHGIGPMANLASVQVDAIMVQLVILLSCLFGLALSLGREERETVLRELADAKHASDLDARRFHALADAVNEGVAMVHPDGTVISCNATLTALKGEGGRPPRHLPTGHFDFAALDGTPVGESELPIARAARERATVEMDLVATHRLDGRASTIRMTAQPTLGVTGEVEQILVVYRDRTEEHERLKALESFAGAVAHDLRTPLSALGGWVELSSAQARLRHPDDSGLLESLTRATAASTRMASLITDLLEFSTDPVGPVMDEIDMNELVRDIVELRALAADPRTHVILEDLPRARGQANLVRQVLDNLIGNAINHAGRDRAATITIHGTHEAQLATYTVTDDGPGIPLAEREMVFRPFHRATADGTGHGLGLAIARRIVTSHGGTITVASGPGGTGAAVTFTLPAADLPTAAFARRAAKTT